MIELWCSPCNPMLARLLLMAVAGASLVMLDDLDRPHHEIGGANS